MPPALRYSPFAACAQLVAATRSNSALRVGCYGPGVRLVQGALLDLGYALSRSTRKGAPDGIFGHETDRAVRAYQGAVILKADGIVGVDTIIALDWDMVKKSKPLPLSPPPIVTSPSSPDYMLGSTVPAIPADAGAGPWNSKARENTLIALKEAIVAALPHVASTCGDDAVAHLNHFFRNTGNPFTIDLAGMLAEVPSARERYRQEVRQAQAFVEALPVGRHQITSRNVQGGYNYSSENRNWYLATGGYVRWGTGSAEVSESGTPRSYILDFNYHFYDRYNWDGGKQIKLFGVTITDEFMGEFHRQGLAREFDCWGSCQRQFKWSHGESITQTMLTAPPASAEDTRVS
jgi:peptidoglycan hydrolase-like protein with peptidoglycan-binding domain